MPIGIRHEAGAAYGRFAKSTVMTQSPPLREGGIPSPPVPRPASRLRRLLAKTVFPSFRGGSAVRFPISVPYRLFAIHFPIYYPFGKLQCACAEIAPSFDIFPIQKRSGICTNSKTLLYIFVHG
jgi:hypothetical protein